MDAYDALVRLGGIGDTKQLLRLTSRKRLRTSVSRGSVVRLGRGRFAVPAADHGLLAAHEVNGYLSHLSAAAHWGWEIVLPPERPQITLPRKRRVPSELTRPMELYRREVSSADFEGWATHPLRTVVDCSRDLPFATALAVADSALRHCRVTAEELGAATAVMRGERGRAARFVATHADARSVNAFESALRALAIEAGLAVIPQYPIEIDGIKFHPDLVDPLRRIVIEADSWAFHADKQSHDRDCARYNAMVSAGWLVLRFTWPQVVFSPTYVVRTIRALMVQRTPGATRTS